MRRLLLHNFQCHRQLELDLEQITVLVGDNDAGKTAVLRALRWLALNDWDGKSGEQITWGEDDCRVQIETEDGHVVIRFRGNAGNGYSLDGEELKAIGKGCPVQVRSLLALQPDNFQSAREPAFWIALSAGQAAQALNDIFNLTAIDDALSNAATELRQARNKVTAAQERLHEARQTKEQLAWVLEADEQLRYLEEMQQQLQDTGTALERRKLLLEQWQEADRLNRHAANVTRLGEEAIRLAQQVLEVESYINRLRHWQQLEDRLCRLEKALQEKEARVAKWLSATCPLCGRKPPP